MVKLQKNQRGHILSHSYMKEGHILSSISLSLSYISKYNTVLKLNVSVIYYDQNLNSQGFIYKILPWNKLVDDITACLKDNNEHNDKCIRNDWHKIKLNCGQSANYWVNIYV